MARKSDDQKYKAKKDFVIHQNDYHLEIKQGSKIDLGDIPKTFHENLVTEGVIVSDEE